MPDKPTLRRRLFTRRNFLAALAVAAAGGAYVRWCEPRWLKAVEVQVPLSKAARPPLRVLQLSDFHASPVVPLEFIAESVTLGLAQKPDLICLTGDFITHKYDRFEEYAAVLRRLSDAAPTFATLGNHDGGSWANRYSATSAPSPLRKAVADSGVKEWLKTRTTWLRHGGYPDTSNVRTMLAAADIECLHNRSVELTVKGRRLTLVGTGDLWAQELDAAAAFASVKKDDERDIIVLSHNPDGKDLLKPHPWQLVLCGHTHGGQLLVPLVGEPFAPVRDHRFVKGLHEWDGRWIHVTKGVGNLHGVRFNCRPEVSLLHIT